MRMKAMVWSFYLCFFLEDIHLVEFKFFLTKFVSTERRAKAEM